MLKLPRLLIFISLFSVSLFQSCAPEEAPDPGTNTDNLIGSWNCIENSQIFGTSNYEVVITKSPSASNQIRIDNFHQLGSGNFVVVNVSGKNLTIQQQLVNNYSFSGNGSIINGNRLNIDYVVDDGGGAVDNVSAGLSK